MKKTFLQVIGSFLVALAMYILSIGPAMAYLDWKSARSVYTPMLIAADASQSVFGWLNLYCDRWSKSRFFAVYCLWKARRAQSVMALRPSEAVGPQLETPR